MRFKLYALLFCLLLLPSSALAGGFCCQMPTGVQDAMYGSSSSGGNFQLRTDYSYSHMHKFVEADHEVRFSSILSDPRFNKNMGVVPNSMDMQRITLSGSYAPTGKVRVMVSVPWVINDMTMQMHNAVMWMAPVKMKQISELGDVTAIGLYRFYQDREPMPTMAISGGVGLKFPTGSHTVQANGKRVHAHMQPGTGSWDPILTLNFVDMLNSDFLLQADATYQIATKNDLGYCAGDTFALNSYLRYNLVDFINVSLGLGYFHSEQADDPLNNYNGQDSRRLTDFVGYTGEDSIWVSPGFQVLPMKHASVDFKFQYPLYYSVGGIQQVTDYRLLAGVSYSF